MKIVFLFILSIALWGNSIVIYNNNLAFIQEERNITINNNIFYINNLSFDLIDSSVAFDSKELSILSYEMYRPKAFLTQILKKNLHKEIKFLFNKEIKEGELITIKPSLIVRDKEQNYYTITNPHNIIFKEFTKRYQKNPFLKVMLQESSPYTKSIKLQYLMRNIHWKSNYIVSLQNTTLKLEAFIEVENKSAQSFKNYTISFVAGTLNTREERPIMFAEAAAPVRKLARKIAPPSKIANYYLYKLPYKGTIKKKSKKFFKLFEKKGIEYKSYSKVTSYFFNRYEKQLTPKAFISFRNSTKAPLPQGIVRVYQDGVYLGEEYIHNTSKNALVTLAIGDAFDLKVDKKILEYQANKNYKKEHLVYTTTNSSNEKKELHIVEKIPSITAKKLHFKTTCQKECSVKKEDAFTKEYTILLEPNSSYSFSSEYEIFY